MIKIVFIALTGVIVSLIFKKTDCNFGFAVAIITGVIIIGFLYDDIRNFIKAIEALGIGNNVSDEHIKMLIKILGISYITQFGSSIAEECGEKFIAKKIELAGKIFIVSLSVPILINLLNTFVGII